MEKIDHTYDPLTGTVTRTGFVDDKMIIRKDADISQAIEYASALRNADDYWKQGVKNNYAHVAHIPDVVVAELWGMSSLGLLAVGAGESGEVAAATIGGHGEIFVPPRLITSEERPM